MIIRDDLLRIPCNGGINIHTALLPKYRGANPTQWALINNEKITGVSLHQITSELDQGEIIDQRETPIQFRDTWKDITSKNKIAIDDLLKQNAKKFVNSTWKSFQQNEDDASFFARRSSHDGYFSWDDKSINIYNKIRALVSPLPGCFYLDGKRKKTINRYISLEEVFLRKYKLRRDNFILNDFIIIPEKFKRFNIAQHSNDLNLIFKLKKLTTDEIFKTMYVRKFVWRKNILDTKIKNYNFDAQFNYLDNNLIKFIRNELNLTN